MLRQKIRMGLVVGSLLVGAAACSSGSSTGSGDEADGPPEEATTPEPSPSTTGTDTDVEPDGAGIDGLRDVRYCEVLLVNSDEDGFSAEVWNTLGLNDCPQDQWDALDAEAIAADRNALTALLNGPRYWVLDAISADTPARDRRQSTFGDLDMFLAATVLLGPETPSQEPYVERTVARDTVFSFRAGSEIYELSDPAGTVYVMQAYSQIEDPDLTIDQLAGLGSVIEPPEGWTFSTRVLDEDLDISSTDGFATVVQDELANTYQRIDD